MGVWAIIALSGFLLVIIGTWLVIYEFKVYKEVHKLEKSWQKAVSFLLDIASGQGGAALGLLLMILGIILLLTSFVR